MSTVYLVDDATIYNKFQSFINKFNKTYPTVEEYNYRFSIFSKNFDKLNELKKAIEDEMLNPTQLDNDTLVLDVTDFFDLSDEEFEDSILNPVVPVNDTDTIEPEVDNDLRFLADLPNSYDWRDYDAVTPVKHQLTCGGCYAFSVVANLESLYAIKYGKTINLSEQQIINCSPYANGCKGGTIPHTYKYLVKASGLASEKEERYLNRRAVCDRSIVPVVKVKSYKSPGTSNNEAIAAFLMKHGVLAVGVNAKFFRYYKKGIMQYSTAKCSPGRLSHAVNIVGFGTSPRGTKYWIVRNTWGPNWGEDGYVRIAWGSCGVNQVVYTGVIE